MKTILFMLIAVTLSLGVSAQRKGFYHVYHPRLYVAPFSYSLGFGYGPYLGYPYGSPFGYPYRYPYPYYGNRVPYKVSLQIQSIKADYQNKIRDVRHDKSLSHSQRRQEIRNLKNERDQEILNAKRDFSRSERMNYRNPGANNSQNRENNNPENGSA
ncbi:MAG: hypothetical protein M3Z92_10455, partial [Bacteroidota bacterium]|nr:hypothetical protein [Bacteroidota bacterium]